MLARSFDNPILVRELRAKGRELRLHVVAGVYVLALGLLFLLVWLSAFQAKVAVGGGGFWLKLLAKAPSPAMAAYWAVLGLQLLAAVTMPSLVAAGTIARERERGTLDLLVVTPLGPGEIYLGRLLAGWLVSAWVLAVGFPVALLASLWAGAGLSRAVLSHVLFLLLGGFSASLSAATGMWEFLGHSYLHRPPRSSGGEVVMGLIVGFFLPGLVVSLPTIFMMLATWPLFWLPRAVLYWPPVMDVALQLFLILASGLFEPLRAVEFLRGTLPVFPFLLIVAALLATTGLVSIQVQGPVPLRGKSRLMAWGGWAGAYVTGIILFGLLWPYVLAGRCGPLEALLSLSGAVVVGAVFAGSALAGRAERDEPGGPTECLLLSLPTLLFPLLGAALLALGGHRLVAGDFGRLAMAALPLWTFSLLWISAGALVGSSGGRPGKRSGLYYLLLVVAFWLVLIISLFGLMFILAFAKAEADLGVFDLLFPGGAVVCALLPRFAVRAIPLMRPTDYYWLTVGVEGGLALLVLLMAHFAVREGSGRGGPSSGQPSFGEGVEG